MNQIARLLVLPVVIGQMCVSVAWGDWIPQEPNAIFQIADRSESLITPAIRREATEDSILLTRGLGLGLSQLEFPDEISDFDASFTNSAEPITPQWTGRFGAIFLNRSGASDAVIAANGVGTPLVNSSQFHFDVPWGFEADVIRHNVLGSGWGLEARYFGVNDFSAGIPAIQISSPVIVPYITPLGSGYTPNELSAVTQSSNLQNVELNARRQATSRVQCLVGFRYVQFDEDLGISISSDTFSFSSTHLISSTNRLYGAQIGAEAQLWEHGRFRLEGVGKVGLYGNQSSNRLNVEILDEVSDSFAASDRRTGVAFLGELGLSGLYSLTDSLSFRASYQAYWLDGVALASGQISTSDPANGTSTVNNSGSVLYHGAFLGLEYRR